MNIELTTMCCLHDKIANRVLMINREKSWKGMAFPGGHLERGESFIDCVRREIKEESGLDMLTLQYKGNVYFYNIESHKKHIIWNYYCDNFSGVLKERCDEGAMNWVEIAEVKKMSLAEGMEIRLNLFLEPGIFDMYIEWNESSGYITIQKSKLD